MDQRGIEAKWKELNEYLRKLAGLDRKFREKYRPDKDGVYTFSSEFAEEFEPPMVQENLLALSLLREILGRHLGKTFNGLYVAAGRDSATGYQLGGTWVYLDRAYNNKIGIVTVKGGIGNFAAPAVTFDFLSDEWSDFLEPAFDVSIIRNPVGINPDINELTGYRPPEDRFEPYTAEWWDRILKAALCPLRVGGLHISEVDYEKISGLTKAEGIRKVMWKYLAHLEILRDPLGLGTDIIPMAEYCSRQGNAEPRLLGYGVHRKVSKIPADLTG